MHHISDILTVLNRHSECSVFAASCDPRARHFESSNPAGLRNSFDRFDHDVSAFSLAIGKGFVLSLYNRDTTRLVGRLLTLHLIYPPHIPTQPAFHFSPTYTYLGHISFIPPHIPTLLASHLSPHKYRHSLHLIYLPTYLCLHSLHLIYPPHVRICTSCISLIPHPPHIPAQPTSHLSPTYTYTAYISFIPHIYLHSLHLIYPPYIPTQPASH